MKHRTFFHWVGVLALVVVAAWGMSRVVDAGGGQCGCGGHGKAGHDEQCHGAAGGPGGILGGHMGCGMVLASKLNLTEDQITAIHAIIDENKDTIQPAMQGVQAKMRALHSAVLSGNADEATIRAAAGEVGKALGDAGVVGSAIATEVRGVLTPEQLEQLDTMLAKCAECTGDCDGECTCGSHKGTCGCGKGSCGCGH